MEIGEYMKRLSAFRIDKELTDRSNLERHLPLLHQLDMIDGSSVAIFDMTTLSYSFMTRRFRFLIGADQDAAMQEGMTYFFQMMHPQDIELFFDTSIRAFSFLTALDPAEKRAYKTCQDFRIRQPEGSWIRLIQQIIVLELDPEGNIQLVLIVNDRSPLHDLDVPARRYMEHMPSGKRVLFEPSDARAPSPVSPRELEVLGLIARGYHSRDIADYLGISVATVNNHRQHILQKMNTTNTAEAVAYAAELQLI